VTIQEPTQVTSCCNLLASVRQFSFNRRSTRMSFSQVQWVFIVEHYLASHSYLTCQNEFRDTFPDSPVPNKSTISPLVNRFRDTGTLQRVASNMRKRVNACIAERGGQFQHFIQHCFLFSDFNVIYFLTNRTCVRNGLRDFSITLYEQWSRCATSLSTSWNFCWYLNMSRFQTLFSELIITVSSYLNATETR
jgi:hypothetical protein